MNTRQTWIIIAIVIILIIGGFFILNNRVYQEKQGEPDTYEPYQASLSGEFACVPHKDTTGPQTRECLVGLRTAAGEYYLVDFNQLPSAPNVDSRDKLSANGTVTPIERLSTDQWQKYNLEGIFSVANDNSLKIEKAAVAGQPAPKITYKNASANLIVPENPGPGDVVGKEFRVTGKARGNWYFEASFPIDVLDKGGKKIASGYAQAEGEWMTTEFVPFKSIVIKIPSTYIGPATLVLHKDNPSGLPENDASISYPIVIEY
jgi:hypothetical protein